MTHTYKCFDCGALLHADTSADEWETLPEILQANGWIEFDDAHHGKIVLCHSCLLNEGRCAWKCQLMTNTTRKEF